MRSDARIARLPMSFRSIFAESLHTMELQWEQTCIFAPDTLSGMLHAAHVAVSLLHRSAWCALQDALQATPLHLGQGSLMHMGSLCPFFMQSFLQKYLTHPRHRAAVDWVSDLSHLAQNNPSCSSLQLSSSSSSLSSSSSSSSGGPPCWRGFGVSADLSPDGAGRLFPLDDELGLLPLAGAWPEPPLFFLA